MQLLVIDKKKILIEIVTRKVQLLLFFTELAFIQFSFSDEETNICAIFLVVWMFTK